MVRHQLLARWSWLLRETMWIWCRRSSVEVSNNLFLLVLMYFPGCIFSLFLNNSPSSSMSHECFAKENDSPSLPLEHFEEEEEEDKVVIRWVPLCCGPSVATPQNAFWYACSIFGLILWKQKWLVMDVCLATSCMFLVQFLSAFNAAVVMPYAQFPWCVHLCQILEPTQFCEALGVLAEDIVSNI